MDKCPLISVIIPTYNREKFIRNSIMSVINQTYKNIEIIVIDDGSTDNTKQCIENIKHLNPNLKYIYKENAGVSSSRNVGIRNANGEYIAFLDSDDSWNETKIEKQIRQIFKDGAKVCYCGTYKKFDNGTNKFLKNKFSRGDILFDVLKGYVDAQTITWLIEKKLLDNNNIMFNEECSFSEDLEFFLKIVTLTKVTCVSEYLSCYNIHKNSLAHNNIINQFQEIDMWERYKVWIDKCEKKNIYDKKNINYIIDRYRIPGAAYRILFDSKQFKDKCWNNYLNKYKKSMKNLNVFVGNDKIRYILYKLGVLNDLMYYVIQHYRGVRNKNYE